MFMFEIFCNNNKYINYIIKYWEKNVKDSYIFLTGTLSQG